MILPHWHQFCGARQPPCILNGYQLYLRAHALDNSLQNSKKIEIPDALPLQYLWSAVFLHPRLFLFSSTLSPRPQSSPRSPSFLFELKNSHLVQITHSTSRMFANKCVCPKYQHFLCLPLALPSTRGSSMMKIIWMSLNFLRIISNVIGPENFKNWRLLSF